MRSAVRKEIAPEAVVTADRALTVHTGSGRRVSLDPALELPENVGTSIIDSLAGSRAAARIVVVADAETQGG